MYSDRLIFLHFWLATIGILFYISSMWVAGIGQGLMLRAFDSDYGTLAYDFIETVRFLKLPYIVRALGGVLFVTGMIVMAFNVYMTIRQGYRERAALEAKLAAKFASA